VRLIKNDDIQPGMFITAGQTQWERTGESLFAGPVTVTQVDRSYMGDVYEVLVIDRPYMIIKKRAERTGGIPSETGFMGNRPVSTVINERPWYECSAEYVNKLAGVEIKPSQAAEVAQ